MKYYALTNTADPRTGFISVGETLTDEQVEALGQKKLDELVENGVIGRMLDTHPALNAAARKSGKEAPGKKEKSGKKAQPDKKKDAGEDGKVKPDETKPDNEQQDDEDDTEDEDDDDLPTLGVDDVIEDDQASEPEKPAAKSCAKGGKAK